MYVYNPFPPPPQKKNTHKKWSIVHLMHSLLGGDDQFFTQLSGNWNIMNKTKNSAASIWHPYMLKIYVKYIYPLQLI